MDSDSGLRTTDFFEDSSSDDQAGKRSRIRGETSVLGIGQAERRSNSWKKEEGRYLGSNNRTDFRLHCGDSKSGMLPTAPADYQPTPSGGFLKLTSTPNVDMVNAPPLPTKSPGRDPGIVRGNPTPPPKSGSQGESSSASSPTELLGTSKARHINLPAPGRGRLVSNISPRVSAAIDEQTAAAMLNPITMEDQILGAHAITLQALLGDREGLQANSVRASKEIIADTVFRMRSASAPGTKRVNIIPPPIAIDSPSHAMSDSYVRTPYPANHRCSQSRPSPLSMGHSSPDMLRNSVIALSLQRHARNRSGSRGRATQLVIPAELSINKAKDGSPGEKEKHFEALDFDDSHLFLQLRAAYAKLAGPFRFFSARTLRSITVNKSCTCEGACNCPSCCCSDRSPISPSRANQRIDTACLCRPRFDAEHGLSDLFDTASMLAHFQRPHLGKGRYVWVRLFRKSAAANSTRGHLAPAALSRPTDPPSRQTKDKKTAAGDHAHESSDEADVGFAGTTAACAVSLEFVEGWSVVRIVTAVFVVLLLAIAASLLWIFLGVNGSPPSPGAGFRDAGPRIGEATLLGLLVLGVGWTIVAAWLAVSWAVR